MFRLIFLVGGRVGGWLQRSPTNRLLRLLRSRRGLRWTGPAMLLGAIYVVAAAVLSEQIARGAPDLLRIVVVLFVWNGIRLIAAGPVNLVRSVVNHARHTQTVSAAGDPGSDPASQPTKGPQACEG